MLPPARRWLASAPSIWTVDGWFARHWHVHNAETFMAFLRQLLRHRRRGQRMLIVLDHAKYHHAVLLRPFLRKYRATLRLLFLPP